MVGGPQCLCVSASVCVGGGVVYMHYNSPHVKLETKDRANFSLLFSVYYFLWALNN